MASRYLATWWLPVYNHLNSEAENLDKYWIPIYFLNVTVLQQSRKKQELNVGHHRSI